MRTSRNIWIVGIVLALGLGRVTLAGDACKAVTKAGLKSCLAGAKSDYALALGKCANISDAAAQKACQDQAKADLQDALGECKDQSDARQLACDKLGGGVYDPPINPANFSTTIDNPLFPLIPGTTFVYVDQPGTGNESNVVAVTHNTRVIAGVTCVEVHDVVYTNGEKTEDTLDWFAQDTDGNVWYFGENTFELEDGLITSLEGSWMTSVDGAKPGIAMKAHPAVGDFYRQEFLLGSAEDLAEVTSTNETANVPGGNFSGCLKTQETTPLEPDALGDKFYAPGVGQILEIDTETGERSELAQVTTN